MRMSSRAGAAIAVMGVLVLSVACGPGKSSGTTTTGNNANRAAATTTKNCQQGAVVGQINGVAKCLIAGEQCQHGAVGQYPKYGFDCVAEGAVYVLRKK